MERFIVRIVIGLVALGIAFGVAFWRRGSTGEDIRKEAHRMVARIDGYHDKPEYYDYLVDEAHDEVYEQAYHMEVGRRGRDRSWMDMDQYEHDLFASMIERAQQEHATSVVEALTKYRTGQGDPAPARR